MNKIKGILAGVGNTIILLGQTLQELPMLFRQWRRVVQQCYFLGNQTLPIVVVLSFFIGGVLALQTGYSLKDFGIAQFLGNIVGVSQTRELGPVMTAILLAGRVGSAYAAELATMKVYQEVDALITMRIPPARILVLPRMAAVFLMMPVLTITSILVGWLGGQVVSTTNPHIALDPAIYWSSLSNLLVFEDVMDGLIKAQIFGFVVILVSCAIALNTRGGPREIGRSVTHAVVSSLILILILDYFVTKILL
jgi:phospholipid/cholesterol/gamma-HCH transport system permease protein